MNPHARFRPWTVLVHGTKKVISVFSTDSPDQIGTVVGQYDGTYDNTLAYAQGAIVRVESTVVVGGVSITPGVYGCAADVPPNGTNNQVPQFPYPTSGIVYWKIIAFSPQLLSVCQNGSKSVYVNASSSF